MHPAVRSYYNLEELWGGKEVNMKKQIKPPRSAAAPKKKPARGKTARRRSRQ